MTLLVETGTASADSESYATVAYADSYFSNNGITIWASLSETEKEQSLRRAATFMCQHYRMQWKGYRVNATQALDWPRYNVEVPDLGVFNVLLPTVVPTIVQQANAELALIAASGELNPIKTQTVTSKQIGPIKVVYDAASPSGKRYVSIDSLLAPLLNGSTGGNMKLRRM
jgi:hypothetical protein